MSENVTEITDPKDREQTLLIIDDDPSSLGVIEEYLAGYGFEVLVARDGGSGVERAQRVEPDLILLDVLMPGMDGFEVCRRLKEHEISKKIPIIFMTSLAATEEKIRGFQLGAVDYITKPVERQELLARIRTHLRLKELNEHLEQMVLQRTQKLEKINQQLEGEIADKERAEESLRRSETRMRLALEGTNQGLWEWDLETGILIYDEVWERMLGYEPGEIVYDADWWRTQTDQTEQARSEAALNDYLSEQAPYYELEYKICTKSGETRWIWARGILFDIKQIGEGGPRRMIGIHRDITEQKKLEGAMLSSQKLASLGTMAAGVAHEINSPLQIITGLCERYLKQTQQDHLDTQSLPSDLNTMNRNAWRIAQIVRSLLEFARPSVQEMILNDLSEIIQDTLLLIEHQLKSWQNIVIEKELADDLPGVWSDRNSLIQVLVNLVANAADAMPDGGKVTIRTWSNPMDEQIGLQVSDTGVGIPLEVQHKIFDPFYTTKDIGHGTGLGLSIVQSIIKIHGGKIELTSNPEEGTAFTITLPLEKPENVSYDGLEGSLEERFS